MGGDVQQARTDSDTGRNRLIVVGAIWLVATAIGEWLVLRTNLHPFGASREARITDDAFNLLMVFSVPVFTFVLVVIGYALVSDRERGGDEDGRSIRTNRLFIGSWLGVTTALSIVVIITPGFSGLDELRAEPEPDLVIDVRAERWSWAYTYSDGAFETQGDLVLPVDRRVMFRMTSTDLIHSFWIPAFRIKQDVVPGKVTSTMVTPEEVGSFDNADELRVQCAELCGVGHARMFTGVTVMEQDAFDEWLAARGG